MATAPASVDRTPSQEQLDELNAMLLPRLKMLHQRLAMQEMAGHGPPLLTGKARAAEIRRAHRQVQRTPIAGQVLAAKILLNAQCPGWEAEAPDLAMMIASKVPSGCAWVDQPLGEVSCH